MNSGTPSRKTPDSPAISKLGATFCCLLAMLATPGCAVLSIPSYRFDGGEHSQGTSSHQVCDDNCECEDYAPVLPTLPTPKCLQRWKEHRNLPDGPKGLKFHPLPTRPMFQPKPGAAPLDLAWQCVSEAGTQFDSVSGSPSITTSDATIMGTQPQYGQIPQRSQWSAIQQPETAQNSAPEKKPSGKSKVEAEELPRPTE